ncbi:MAG: hypothetical protein AB1402_03530 [Bacillota bacterium]
MDEDNAWREDTQTPGDAKSADHLEPPPSKDCVPDPEAESSGALTPRQLDILVFLTLVGEADEGDIAYGLRLAPEELARVPAGFLDSPGEFVARRELEALSRLGLAATDGITWELTNRGREVLATLEHKQPAAE